MRQITKRQIGKHLGVVSFMEDLGVVMQALIPEKPHVIDAVHALTSEVSENYGQVIVYATTEGRYLVVSLVTPKTT